jgi:hypothetical protein
MTTSDSQRSTYWLGGLVAVASLAIGFVVAFVVGGRAPETSDDAPAPPIAENLDAWQVASDATVDIRLDPDRGPVWHVDGARVPLTPLPPLEAPLEWSHRSTDRLEWLIGRGEWRGHPLVVRWAFASGNPQARMSIELRGVSRPGLELAFSAETTWPRGSVVSLDRRLRARPLSSDHGPRTLSAWGTPWVQWSRGEAHVTLTRWTGDGLGLAPTSEGGAQLELHLWRPDRHPLVRRCGGGGESSAARSDAGATSSDVGTRGHRGPIRAEATFVFGDAPLVAPWRYPEGQLGVVAPVFDRSTAHPDRTLHDGASHDAGDWLSRARTLLYGHSNPDDPRFSNGGLLGQGLGGAVVLPTEFAGPEVVRQFRSELDGTRADVALRGGMVETTPPFRALLVDSPTCEFGRSGMGTLDVVVDRWAEARGRVHDLMESRASLDRPPLSAPVGGHPVSVVMPRLDGSQRTLVESILTGPKLRELVEARGIFTFATPLTASRNPLSPSARESLLSPERKGEWTLSEPFTMALANLSIMREVVPIAVLGPSELVSYWRRARRLEVRWRADGGVTLHNPTASDLRGATLVVGRPDHSGKDGSTTLLESSSIRIDGQSTTRRRGDERHGEHLWTWTTLGSGETKTVRFGGGESKETALEGPESVQWSIEDEGEQ